MPHPRHPSPIALCYTFVGLIVLLLATIGFAQLHLGPWNTPIGLGISIIKTLLIVVLFMNLLNSTGAIRLVSCAALVWLSFAIMFVVTDYRTRGWDETQETGLAKGVHIHSYNRTPIPSFNSPKNVENDAEPVDSSN